MERARGREKEGEVEGEGEGEREGDTEREREGERVVIKFLSKVTIFTHVNTHILHIHINTFYYCLWSLQPGSLHRALYWRCLVRPREPLSDSPFLYLKTPLRSVKA